MRGSGPLNFNSERTARSVMPGCLVMAKDPLHLLHRETEPAGYATPACWNFSLSAPEIRVRAFRLPVAMRPVSAPTDRWPWLESSFEPTAADRLQLLRTHASGSDPAPAILPVYA